MSGVTTPIEKSESAGRGALSRDVAKSAGTQLVPKQLEDRATIYRGGKARREVDAFREIRTRLLAAAEGNFVTLVAPVSRGSGGSFVARNLAASMSFDETRSALLVDCDLRYPSQNVTMRLTTDAGGLTDYLDGQRSEVGDVIYETGVPGLRLLPAGATREIGTEYFSSSRMRLLVDTLRSQYPHCHLFLDGPPVQGSPDARILAELADVVILVAGYAKDTPATIAQAASNFPPEKFAGVVFNEGV
ncbi:MAG: polysaccharide biosynthesis protein [Pseudoxanthomonas sp.]